MAVVAPVVTSYLVLVGLLLGSFINLAADRMPRGESLIWPRSHCRSCNRQLDAIDLLPVAGYVIRGGRCATCGTQIGITGPIVEAICGACVLAGIAWLGLWPGAVLGFTLLAFVGIAVIGLAMRHRVGAEAPS